MDSLSHMLGLKGRTAIVTGGERGIGFALAMGLAKAGADILIAGMAQEEFHSAAAKIRRTGVRCTCIQTDISDEDSVKEMAESALAFLGKIDILINNAGVNQQFPAEKMPLEVWKNVIGVNLTGTFLVCREIGARMIRQGGGCIINIASMSGLVVNPLPQHQCAYNSSKAAVIMLTKCLACEWAHYRIRVNAIAPGFIRTSLTRRRLETPGDPTAQKWIDGTPMNRVGDPEELVSAALYLAGDGASYTTGTVLSVDGGYTCL